MTLSTWTSYVSFEKFVNHLKDENYKQDIIDYFDNYDKSDLLSLKSSYYNGPSVITKMNDFIRKFRMNNGNSQVIKFCATLKSRFL